MNNHTQDMTDNELVMTKLNSGNTLMRLNLQHFIRMVVPLKRPSLLEKYIRMEALNAAIRAELDIMEEEAANGH